LRARNSAPASATESAAISSRCDGGAALLFDFATRADYRAAVKKEFDGIKVLFGEYQEALKRVYTVPTVPDPK